MLIFAVIMDKACLHVTAAMLDTHNVTIDEPLEILRDMIATLKEEIALDNGKDGKAHTDAVQYAETLTSWAAAYDMLLESEPIPDGEEVDGM